MNRFSMGPLCDPEPGASGGDSGNGGVMLEQVMVAVNSAVNGLDKRYGKQLKNLQDALEALKPKDASTDDGEPKDEPKDKARPDPKVSSLEKQLLKLTESLEGERRARKEAEERAELKERHSLLRAELAKFKYVKDNGIDAAFKLLASEVKRAEDGSLIAGDDQPLAEYVRAQLEGTYDYLLAPKPTGGAGASGGGRGKTAVVGLEAIKPGMSKDDERAVLDQIRAAMAG